MTIQNHQFTNDQQVELVHLLCQLDGEQLERMLTIWIESLADEDIQRLLDILWRQKPEGIKFSGPEQKQIVDLLKERMNRAELGIIALASGIPDHVIENSTSPQLAIVSYCNRRSLLLKLLDAIWQERVDLHIEVLKIVYSTSSDFPPPPKKSRYWVLLIMLVFTVVGLGYLVFNYSGTLPIILPTATPSNLPDSLIPTTVKTIQFESSDGTPKIYDSIEFSYENGRWIKAASSDPGVFLLELPETVTKITMRAIHDDVILFEGAIEIAEGVSSYTLPSILTSTSTSTITPTATKTRFHTPTPTKTPTVTAFTRTPSVAPPRSPTGTSLPTETSSPVNSPVPEATTSLPTVTENPSLTPIPSETSPAPTTPSDTPTPPTYEAPMPPTLPTP